MMLLSIRNAAVTSATLCSRFTRAGSWRGARSSSSVRSGVTWKNCWVPRRCRGKHAGPILLLPGDYAVTARDRSRRNVWPLSRPVGQRSESFVLCPGAFRHNDNDSRADFEAPQIPSETKATCPGAPERRSSAARSGSRPTHLAQIEALRP